MTAESWNNVHEPTTILLNLSKVTNGVREPANDLLLHGVFRQAKEYGWQLLHAELTVGDIPSTPPPLGAIIRDLPNSPMAEKLRGIGCPTVRIGRLPHPHDHKLPAVIQDIKATGALAAEHFAERRFWHVGYVGRDPWASSRPLFKAFQKSAHKLGLECHLYRIKQEAGQTEAGKVARYKRREQLIGNWLQALPKPVGILNYDDFMAGKICAICRAAGLEVPEDVAVLGIGNRLFDCEAATTPLSSLAPNYEEIGRQAVCLLKNLVNGGELPSQVIQIPPKYVVERHSTNVMAVPSPVVARAMRFIWDNFDRPLSVSDIAERVAVSQSKLKRAFRRHLGHGVNAELRCKRLERCAELLISTDKNVADIAAGAGFSARPYFYRAFRKAYGMTPHQYRLQYREP